jgi:hypothetical protein
MKFSWRLLLGLFVSALALAACLPFSTGDDKGSATDATLAAIPGVQRGAIVISNFERSSDRISWRALTPEGEFNCEANRHFEWAACTHT